MSQEWKKHFQQELANLAKINEEKAPAGRKEINEEDILQFLAKTQVKEMLEFVRDNAFQGKGRIEETFTHFSYTTGKTETTVTSYADPETETTYITNKIFVEEEKRIFLAGIALNDIPIIHNSSHIKSLSSIFIGFYGNTHDIVHHRFGLYQDFNREKIQIPERPRFQFITENSVTEAQDPILGWIENLHNPQFQQKAQAHAENSLKYSVMYTLQNCKIRK